MKSDRFFLGNFSITLAKAGERGHRAEKRRSGNPKNPRCGRGKGNVQMNKLDEKVYSPLKTHYNRKSRKV